MAIDLLGKECGTDPLSVAEFAKSRFAEDKGYDICYCLIDRDTHAATKFEAAVQLAEKANSIYKNREFTLVVSYPCVEFWFLCHFVYTRAPFVEGGGRSPAENVLAELRKHLPKYDKSAKGEMEKLLEHTTRAIKNSVRAWNDASTTGEKNPSTGMHLVVEKIIELSPGCIPQ